MMNNTPPRGKALPPRPSADLGYGGQGGYGGPQSGYRNENINPRNNGSAPQNGRRTGSQEPSGRIVLDGYRKDIMNGFEAEHPRYNPVSC